MKHFEIMLAYGFDVCPDDLHVSGDRVCANPANWGYITLPLDPLECAIAISHALGVSGLYQPRYAAFVYKCFVAGVPIPKMHEYICFISDMKVKFMGRWDGHSSHSIENQEDFTRFIWAEVLNENI